MSPRLLSSLTLTRRAPALAVMLLGAAGCHLVFPFDPGQAPGSDGPPVADGPPLADGPLTQEGPVPLDGPEINDTAPPDAPPLPDGPPLVDAPPLPDAPLVDAPPLPDTPPPPDPCANMVSPIFSYSGTMKICPIPGGGNQCKAASACNAAFGWSLCTATQFRLRGGATTGTGYGAWLASCVRAGSMSNAPTEKICACKNLQSGAAIPLGWGCSTPYQPLYSTQQHFMGVRTWNICRRLGLSSANNAAFWTAQNSSTTVSHAVCCY